jgi:hypothetical protein
MRFKKYQRPGSALGVLRLEAARKRYHIIETHIVEGPGAVIPVEERTCDLRWTFELWVKSLRGKGNSGGKAEAVVILSKDGTWAQVAIRKLW